MLACEQLLDMMQKADTVAAIAENQGDEIARERRDEFTNGRDEADFVALASKYRGRVHCSADEMVWPTTTSR